MSGPLPDPTDADQGDGGRATPASLLTSPVLGPILRPYWRYAPLVVLLGLLTTLLESVGIGALVPLIGLLMGRNIAIELPGPMLAMERLVGTVAPHGQAYVLLGIIMALIAGKAMAHVANNALVGRVHAAACRDVMDAMARKTLDLEFSLLLRGLGARIFPLFGQASWWSFEAIRALFLILQASASVVVFAAILVWLDWRLSLIAVLGVTAVSLVMSRIEAAQRQRSLAASERDKALLIKAREITDGARVIRLFGQAKAEEQRFSAVSRESFRDYRVLNVLGGVVRPLFDFLVACMFVSLLLAAFMLAVPIEQVTAFLLLILRAQPQAAQITQARAALAAYAGSVGEVEWLLRLPSPPPPAPDALAVPAIDRTITFDRVDYAYPDGSVALAGASFAIQPGTVTALVGKSGAGKSTVINLLTGLVAPASGAVRFGDAPLSCLDMAQWRQRIAVAGQDVGLFDGSVADNIAYGCPDASAAQIGEAARAAGVEQFLAALPHGLATRVGEGGGNLSGGQRQRVALARALLRRPDLLILDEATNAVDAVTENEVMALLDDRRWFRTALVISHRQSTLSACSAAIVLQDGRVVEAGPLQQTAYHAVMGGAP
ncbi:ABC transporter ATP-binding protein [Novosphingobium percolationis]|uniref:ABC transporter ATP-binding protein n=1 Tax=Novosphingobium percolationis TaxID=2871811 RepID=UPI001CD2CE35|nr:ABC transporter ATP-binding protein [Novosphingobium percolationis]